MKYLKSFFLLIIVFCFLIFAIVNREAVSISLWPLPYSAELPKFLFAIICFAMGSIVGGLILSLRYAKYKWQMRAAQKRAVLLEDEIRVMKSERQTSLTAL